MTDQFIHFRTQSSYSMLESAIKIDKLVQLSQKNNMSAVCLSDRGNLFASLEFAMAAAKQKIQPIHGSILNIVFQNKGASDFAEISLIAKDQEGYQNLLKLVSLTFTDNDRSVRNHITWDDLLQYNQGLIVLSCYADGVVGKLLQSEQKQAAFDYASKLQQIFGDRFYLEVMRHNLTKERKIEANYLEIARKINAPLIATNNVLFGSVAEHDAHDVLLCISAGVVRDVQERRRVSNQCYFKSPAEMIELFKDLPEAIENTVHLKDRCYVMAKTNPPSLPNFTSGEVSEDQMLRQEAENGLDARLKQKFAIEKTPEAEQKLIKQEYIKRLEYELEILCSMNFAGYFLIVSDFIRWSKENNIAVGPGRGSGAGSIIAWTLLITDLDPIKFGLLFERFLNPERVSMPDFDIDFCQERREEVISYVRNKYGDERVGQIITFGKMQAKAVIKDVARVLSLGYSVADYLTELVPFNALSPVTLKQAISDVKELKEAYAGRGLYNIDGDKQLIKQVLDTALSLEGLHRHASTHAAGIVIANQNMTETVPVYKDVNGDMLIVQYSMKYAEAAGLVKFDFLGLQTLTVITKTLELIKKTGTDINIEDIPYDDAGTFKMLTKGLSTGVFQFESVGMKSALRKLGPDSVDDLIALGALYRPGPMDNIPTYIACKHGKQKEDYLHPILEPILKATYGVIIYQEQVMEIAKILSGYSLGAADLLRRAMGKKVKAEMDAQEEIFVSGAIKNNVPATQAKAIFATVAKFAGYGFNKSHASAYGVISYQTAYLKANFPVEFFVAAMNLDIDSSDKINIFLQEVRTFEIDIIPPDINQSEGGFGIKNDGSVKSIIYAIGAIKNVTASFGRAVMEERAKKGEFKSITDFAERIKPKLINRRLLENVIKAGCFDSLHPNRNSLIQSVPKIMAYASSFHQEQASNQFSLIAVNSISSDILIQAPALPTKGLAQYEFEVLGLFLKNHPLQDIKKSLQKCNVKDSTYINNELQNGSHYVKMAGVIVKKDARMSKRGRFITLILSEPSGIFEITIYNEDTLQEYAHLLKVGQEIVAHCDISKDKGGIRITARKFASIEEELNAAQHELHLHPKNSQQLAKIIDILKNNNPSKKPNSNVTIYMQVQENFVAKADIAKKLYLQEEDISILSEYCN